MCVLSSLNGTNRSFHLCKTSFYPATGPPPMEASNGGAQEGSLVCWLSSGHQAKCYQAGEPSICKGSRRDRPRVSYIACYIWPILRASLAVQHRAQAGETQETKFTLSSFLNYTWICQTGGNGESHFLPSLKIKSKILRNQLSNHHPHLPNG